ncbi:hypothetical protein [uncultured Alistipes sp.]|uniref:hypothetical protein n=1 Tax=uncultured Alistipes sp. TaxID=538949 RepID=UPI0026251DA0|nr:hypothetical protein [uncultured Alistipes sp.]
MRRLLLCLLVAAAACAATSCRRAVERSASKIRIEAVGRPVVLGPTAFELPLTVDNGSAHRLRLGAASLALRCGDARALELRLAGEVCIERRTRVETETRWRMRIADPLALYVVVERLRRGELSDLAVDYAVEGRGGPAAVNISRERVPLSEFLNTFGLTTDDVVRFFRTER